MIIVVSDTNVFVALHKCGLLITVFSNTRVQVSIPTEIYEELTGAAHRVSKEYPELSDQVRSFRHNLNHGQPITLDVRDHKSIDDISAMTAFYQLDKEAALDKGEREAIRSVSEALGMSIEQIAKKSNKTPSTIHKALGKGGNPTLGTLTAVLKTMGLKLSVEKAS